MSKMKKIFTVSFYIFFENSILLDMMLVAQAYLPEMRVIYSPEHPYLPLYSYLLIIQNILTILLSIFYLVCGVREKNKGKIIFAILAIITTALVWVPVLNFFHIPFGNY